MNSLPDLRSLSPVSARMCLAVERFCLHRLALPHGMRLVLALSGGADSTALACILHILSPRLELELFALTLDHGLRPEAEADARWTQAFCAWLGIPCARRRVDVTGLAAAKGWGLEEAGRHTRYALLEEERRAQKANFVVLGHHAGDLSEDVLLRLARGTGWPALGGMAARDDARRLLRPLLFTKPQDLRDLLTECGVSWREDASNASLNFMRNRLRHTVLPLLRRENPALDRGMAALWQLAQCDADYWETLLAEALAAHPWHEESQDGLPALLLPRELLAGLHPAARLRLYLKAVRLLVRQNTGQTGERSQARAHTLLELDAALREGRGNTRFQLPGGIEARLKSGAVRFGRTMGLEKRTVTAARGQTSGGQTP